MLAGLLFHCNCGMNLQYGGKEFLLDISLWEVFGCERDPEQQKISSDNHPDRNIWLFGFLLQSFRGV